jgi:hypothetical protein
MTAAAPADFFRLKLIGFGLRGNGRLRRAVRQLRIVVERLRHQRRGMCGGSKRCKTRRHTSGDLEKFPAFHFFLLQSRVMRSEFRHALMNAC